MNKKILISAKLQDDIIGDLVDIKNLSDIEFSFQDKNDTNQNIDEVFSKVKNNDYLILKV